MTFRPSTFVAALTLATTMAVTAEAQTNRVHFGTRVSYISDAEAVGLGVQLGIQIARHLEFYPSIDNFFVDQGSYMHFNADVKFRMPLESSDWLYLGTGLNVARSSYRDNNTAHWTESVCRRRVEEGSRSSLRRTSVVGSQ